MHHVVTETRRAAAVDVEAKLREFARRPPGLTPVVSVYLDTRWTDEHQRGRVRAFLKNEMRKAAAMAAGELDADLAWIAAQGERLVGQELHPGAAGIAMFVGESANGGEVLPFAVPFTDTFTVGERPHLRPLVDALGTLARAALLFVDSESARLVELTEEGAGDEIVMTAKDPLGQHRRGGFLLQLQSRYQRHIHEHRARHFEAVAEALTGLVEDDARRVIVLAGEPRNLAVFRTHVPPRLARRIVGEIAGAWYEPSSALIDRALTLIQQRAAGELAAAVESLLIEAEGGGRAAGGVDAALEAVNRGTVARLYVLRTYDEVGRVCRACAALQRAADDRCRFCGGATAALELGEAMIERVLAAGGDVASVDAHAALARVGGVAARLRYPPR